MPTEQVKIKPGQELDLAVAYACKYHVVVRDGFISVAPSPEFGDSAPTLFMPSTDLNAAFAAAERVGLFENFYLGRYPGNGFYYIADEFHGVHFSEATAALAICAAILELAEDKETE